jgi:hypothetical protein
MNMMKNGRFAISADLDAGFTAGFITNAPQDGHVEASSGNS